MVPFNRAFCSSDEISYITELLNNIKNGDSISKISGDGTYTRKCHEWLANKFGSKFLLTTSCSSALDMMGILLDAEYGSEVIMPSFTFVSTANAFVLRGLKPVFVDIRPDTCNLDEKLVEDAITSKTVAIVPVHYAGVSCEMDSIMKIAKNRNLYVFEDAAQGFNSTYKNKYLGTIGDLGTYSFHETKNIVCGEGGCLIINNQKFADRAEVLREKGTNRSQFFRGQVDKYTWVDVGSSYLPSDILAAFLYAQLKNEKEINDKRMNIWNKYYNFFETYEKRSIIRRPIIPTECTHNAHMFYILFNNLELRTEFISYLQKHHILSVFHYIPLHSAPAGLKYGRIGSSMDITNKVSDTLVRLPLFASMTDENLNLIMGHIQLFFEKHT